jgi:hypothetical protein
MQDWHHEFVANLSASEWVETVVGDLLRGGVFVFTPEGDFVNLPKGSTVIDFAYHIRSEVGNEMVMAKVNGIPVHPSYEVQNAEVVEIVRSQGPVTTDAYLRHREWVRYAATRSARYRIQKFLREHEALDPTAQAHPPGPQSPAAEQTLAEGGGVTGSMGGSLEEDLLVGDPYNQGETMWLIVKSDDRFGLLSEITRVISSHSLSIRSYSGSAGGGVGRRAHELRAERPHLEPDGDVPGDHRVLRREGLQHRVQLDARYPRALLPTGVRKQGPLKHAEGCLPSPRRRARRIGPYDHTID